METWKDIPGYEGLYQVSDFGRIKSLPKYRITGGGGVRHYESKIMKTSINNWGYPTLSLCKDGKHKTHKVHRLVAKAFISNLENKPQVNHINGIKTDNRVENLEWATESENIRHAYDSGLNQCSEYTKRKISKANSKKLIDTSTGNRYNSIKSAASSLGINYHTLRNMVSGHNNNWTKLIYE